MLFHRTVLVEQDTCASGSRGGMKIEQSVEARRLTFNYLQTMVFLIEGFFVYIYRSLGIVS